MNMPLAHAFGTRVELPIPVLAFVLGGAAIVAVSFVVVLPTGVKPMDNEPPDTAGARRVSSLAGIVGLVVLAGLCWAGFAGDQAIPENILPTVFWVYLWVVVPLLSGVIGDFSSGVNVYGYLAQLGGRMSPRKRSWPQQLGWWPAVALLALGTLAELVFNKSTTLPFVLAWMLVGYAAYCLLMGAIFGAKEFREHGELFTVLFSTWGRFGYFRFGAPGRRGFAGGLEAPFQRSFSRTIFVLMLLVSISFDGLLATPQWANFENAHIAFNDLHEQEVFRTVAFLVLTLLIYGIFLTFSYAVSRAGGVQRNVRDTFSHLLPSLVPIAFGYLFAHYLQYVLINGQLILPLLGAPGGSGTNLHLPYPFNDSYEVNTTFLPNSFYWYLDVLAIVAVHIVAVVLAHRSLARVSATERTARRAEYPWIVAMVAYTALSLWLLAQPLAESKSGSS